MLRAIPYPALLAAWFALPAFGQEIALPGTGEAVVRAVTDSQTFTYRIAAAADEFIGVTITPHGAGLTEQLFAPDGRLAVEFHGDPFSDAVRTADFVAGAAGSYRLEVRASTKTAAGRYEIRLREVRAATAHDRQLYEARALDGQAFRLSRAGEFEQAFPLARRALDIAEREAGAGDPYTGHLAVDVAQLLFQKGRFQEAEELCRREQSSVEGMRLLGEIYSARGEAVKAQAMLQEALERTERTFGRDHAAVIECLLAISSFHIRRDDNDHADQELKRALAIADGQLGTYDPLTAEILNNLGVLYNSQKLYDRAEPLLQRSVRITEENWGRESVRLALELQNLALIAQERDKDYAKALALYGRAVALQERSGGPDTPRAAGMLNNMANVYKSMGNFPKALEMHQRVHAIAEQRMGPYAQLTMISLGNIARTYAAAGDAGKALEAQERVDRAIEQQLTLNLAIGSERQKLAYFDSLAARTSRTISLQAGLAAGLPAAARLAALVVLERKGRVLDAMSESFAALRGRLDAGDRKLFDEWNATAGEYARMALGGPGDTLKDEYARRLAALAERRERVESEISRRSAEFRAQRQPVTLEAVQAAIPAEVALIEYVVYEPFDPRVDNNEAYGAPRYMAYVLRRDGEVQWKDVGAAAAIDRTVEQFRGALRDPHRRDVESLARALDEKVLRPLRALAGDASQLLISPDGALNLIPFEALSDEKGRFVVEHYRISYLTSGRDLLRLEVERPAKSAPLLMANPFFGEPATSDRAKLYFAPLAGTEPEVRAIQAHYPEATVLTGRQATEAALRQAEAPRILHIATHGFFLGEGEAPNPLLRSGLALAGANLVQEGSTRGIVTALEASGLNLWGTSLVTLSACDTGVGEVKNGDGVYGLRRAFILAGAESLVMSLWPVSDSMTRQMMTAYYAGLQQGLGRGQALREAQLAMLERKERRHPFYWASFILSGDWKRLQ